jgi:hypothetical protein
MRPNFSQQRLAAARGADQQYIRFRELYVIALRAMGEALIMIMHRDRQHPLGVALTDHVIVEHGANVAWSRHAVARLHQRGLVLLADDVHAQLDAFIADEYRRAGDQLADLMLALAAERAVERVLGIAAAGLTHRHSINRRGTAPIMLSARPCSAQPRNGSHHRLVEPKGRPSTRA